MVNGGCVQVESFRRREQEVIKMKKDIELINVQHESDMASFKKRSQELLNEVNEQLEKANKQKSKCVQTLNYSFIPRSLNMTQ